MYGEKLGHLPPKTVNDLWDAQRRRDEYQAAYLSYWESTRDHTRTGRPVDAIITPVSPTVGYERGKGLYPGYTAVFNVLDYSVVVVRAGKADAAKDLPYSEFKSQGDFDSMIHAQCMYFFIVSNRLKSLLYRNQVADQDSIDDPVLFHDSPIGLQVVCRRLEEEKVLAIAEEVERIIYRP